MATHALIPRQWREALNAVVAATGTQQRELIARAADALLARADGGFIPDSPPLPRGSLVALVARIPPEQQRALHALAERTRIRYSEWLRQAVVDVLRAHGKTPEASGDDAQAPAVLSVEAGRCRCGFRLLVGERVTCEDCREATP